MRVLYFLQLVKDGSTAFPQCVPHLDVREKYDQATVRGVERLGGVCGDSGAAEEESLYYATVFFIKANIILVIS